MTPRFNPKQKHESFFVFCETLEREEYIQKMIDCLFENEMLRQQQIAMIADCLYHSKTKKTKIPKQKQIKSKIYSNVLKLIPLEIVSMIQSYTYNNINNSRHFIMKAYFDGIPIDSRAKIHSYYINTKNHYLKLFPNCVKDIHYSCD